MGAVAPIAPYRSRRLCNRIFRPRRSTIRRCGLLLQAEWHGLSVGLSVTIVRPAKMAEPIEMPFGLWTRLAYARSGCTLAQAGEYD